MTQTTTVVPLATLIQKAGVDAFMISIRGNLAERHQLCMTVDFLDIQQTGPEQSVGVFTLEHQDSRVHDRLSNSMFLCRIYHAPRRVELWQVSKTLEELQEQIDVTQDLINIEDQPAQLVATAGYSTLTETAVHLSLTDVFAAHLFGQAGIAPTPALDPKRFDYSWGQTKRTRPNLNDMSPLLPALKKDVRIPASDLARENPLTRIHEQHFLAQPYGTQSSVVTAVRKIVGEPEWLVLFFADRLPSVQYNRGEDDPNYPTKGSIASFDHTGKLVTFMATGLIQ